MIIMGFLPQANGNTALPRRIPALAWLQNPGIVLAGLFVAVNAVKSVGAVRAVTELLLLLLALALVILIHELGHLLAGRLVGFRAALLLVGPLEITRGPAGLRIRRNRLLRALGAALSLPRDDHRLRERMSLVTLAGPLASLALGLLSAALYVALRRGTGMHGASLPQAVTEVTRLVSFLSLGLAAINLIPFDRGGMVSDGGAMVQFLRGGIRAERRCAFALVANAELIEGLRPRDWNPDWIRRATVTDKSTPHDPGICKMAYLWAIDRGDVAEAGAYLQRAVDAARAQRHPILPNVTMEKVFFDAYYLQHLREARELLAGVPHRALVEPRSRLRVDAALLRAQGEWEPAADRARQALEALHRELYMGRFALEEEWLRSIIDAAGRHDAAWSPEGEIRQPVRANHGSPREVTALEETDHMR